jgi:SP family sugar:H+ symporter-like MFS transporter
VAIGRAEAAQEVLRRLARPDQAAAEVGRIAASLERDRRPSWRDLLDAATGRVRPIVWVGVALAAFQQLVGINVVFYYGEVLWRAAGFSESDALRINVIGGTINVVSTLIAIALVDRWGRKPLQVIGLGGAYALYALFALLSFFFVRPAVCETEGRTLEQM